MIHPNTELRFVSESIGYGVFATAPIPRGTVVYAKDPLEVEVTPGEYARMSPTMQVIVEKYSYIDQHGIRIISWDHAKYVNHRCDCNTMSTGYGFEIALRDICEGEEITDEYALFNLIESIELACDCPNCRRILRPEDIDTYYPIWDEKVKLALPHILDVAQPLWEFVPEETRRSLQHYLSGRGPYRSVIQLKYCPMAVKH